MNKNIFIYLSIFLVVFTGGILLMKSTNNIVHETNQLEATVLAVSNNNLTVQDQENIIYTIENKYTNINIGDHILIEYSGFLNKNKEKQNISVTNYSNTKVSQDDFNNYNTVDWDSNGMFKSFYTLANNKLKTLTIDEKIGQLFLVRYPESNQISLTKKYNFAGYVFYEKDFKDKNKNDVIDMMNDLQEASKIPLLTAVDEEGGTVVRISSNPNLVDNRFKSPSVLYNEGGFDLIKQDTIYKSSILNSLGININLAPVVDVATDPNSYMYDRTLQKDTNLTSDYAKTVISASKNGKVSYVLKHFPGYGNNGDTHNGTSTDTRSYDDIYDNDLPPFKAGIEAHAEAILISHNVVTGIDDVNPASLSTSLHNLLRNDLGFTGIIVTDDLGMGAVSSINNNVVKAILAGNDLIIVSDYEDAINQVKSAINNGGISEEFINKLAGRVLAWKYYKGLIYENQK